MSSLSKEAVLVHEALVARGLETPMRAPVQEIDNETRKRLITGHMTEIMQLLNLDLSDDSLMETPHRIAKMYVDEIFSGLDYSRFPKITVIENKMKVDEMVTVRDITLTSIKAKQTSGVQQFLAKFATIFTPLIPGFIAAGCVFLVAPIV